MKRHLTGVRSHLPYIPLPEGAAPDGGAPNGGAGKPSDPPATYTPPASQEELDRIVSDRLARERAKFADYPDLKKAAEKLAEIEAANATETEKAVKAARADGAAEAMTKANARVLGAEARALAAEAKFRNPNTAARLLDLSGVKVGDDGDVDSAAIKALLDDLAKAEPYLVDDGKGGKPAPDGAQGGGGKPVKGASGRAEAERRFGVKQQN